MKKNLDIIEIWVHQVGRNVILYSQKLARLTKTNRSGRFSDFRFFVKNRDRILREPIFEDFDHEIAISYFLVLCTRKFIKFCAFHVPELCRQRQFILTNELVENRIGKNAKSKDFRVHLEFSRFVDPKSRFQKIPSVMRKTSWNSAHFMLWKSSTKSMLSCPTSHFKIENKIRKIGFQKNLAFFEILN